jgi:hypothetical protein
MKLWSIIFPDVTYKYQSIRAAAPNKNWLLALCAPDFEQADHYILSYMGEAQIDPGIIEKVLRGGEIERWDDLS